MYSSLMLKKGELDERMFLPLDISNVFEPAFDCESSFFYYISLFHF